MPNLSVHSQSSQLNSSRESLPGDKNDPNDRHVKFKCEYPAVSHQYFVSVLTMLEFVSILLYGGINEQIAEEILKWIGFKIENNMLKAVKTVEMAKNLLNFEESIESSSNFDSEEWNGDSRDLTGGLLADEYAIEDEDETQISPEEKHQKFGEVIGQVPGSSLIDSYPNADLVAGISQDGDPENSGTSTKSSEIGQRSLLPVPMSQEFSYTCAIIADDPFHGLLHSFLRHNSQWKGCILVLSRLIGLISSPIRKDLRNIEAAKDSASVWRLLKAFNQKIKTEDFDKALKNGDKSAIWAADMQIYKFLRDNINYNSYLGEGMNNNKKVQVMFNVEDTAGKNKVMVVCVSDELYRANPEDMDSRPIRTITTIFFIEEKDAAKKLIFRMF